MEPRWKRTVLHRAGPPDDGSGGQEKRREPRNRHAQGAIRFENRSGCQRLFRRFERRTVSDSGARTGHGLPRYPRAELAGGIEEVSMRLALVFSSLAILNICGFGQSASKALTFDVASVK